MPGMKITDEMVAKFREAQLRFYGRAVCNDEAKQLLDAALNVPTENVPYVSQEMVVAGEAIILNDFWKRYTPDWAQSAARESYRAMRKLEPRLRTYHIRLLERRPVAHLRKDDLK